VRNAALRAAVFAVSCGLALLAALPSSTIAGLPALCLFRRWWGIECWGCGMTRALSCALHGQLAAAFAYNRGVVVVFPLLLLVAGFNLPGTCQKPWVRLQ